MTQIKFRSNPLWHESSAEERGRKILVSVQPNSIQFRLKGTHGIVELPITAAFDKAAFLKAQASAPVRHTHTVKRGIV